MNKQLWRYIPEGTEIVTSTILDVFMEHGWKRRLGLFAAAAVLAGGVGTTSACNSSATGNGGLRSSTATPAGTSVLAGSDFCENVKKYAADAKAGAGLSTLTADIQQLLASAPAEIKPDVQKLSDPLLVLGGKLSPDQADHSTDITQLPESARHYEAYVQSHCAGSGTPGIN